MTKLYSATNPQALIDLFERNAKIADERKGMIFLGQAYAWRAAAEMLRNTEFVGWTPNSRIVEEIKPERCDCGLSIADCFEPHCPSASPTANKD